MWNLQNFLRKCLTKSKPTRRIILCNDEFNASEVCGHLLAAIGKYTTKKTLFWVKIFYPY